MSTFKERLIEENEQLEFKINKLLDFYCSNKFEEVDKFQKSLLKIQLSAMITYNDCLKERLEYLSKE